MVGDRLGSPLRVAVFAASGRLRLVLGLPQVVDLQAAVELLAARLDEVDVCGGGR